MALAASMGVNPVELLLRLTLWAAQQWEACQTKETADALRDYAREAAPYVAPKIAVTDRAITFDLPTISGLDDLPIALLAILSGTASGALTPSEAGALAALVDGFRRASESADLLKRIEALEANHA